jgi:hypothetical protein
MREASQFVDLLLSKYYTGESKCSWQCITVNMAIILDIVERLEFFRT